MPTTLDATTAIRRGLNFLQKQQERDGSFVSFSSASMQPFRRTRSWQTTFVPALMLASLASVNEPSAASIRRTLADFLLAQRDANGSYNYWSKAAPEYRSMAYPNDLDDTFCVLAGLYLHDPSLVDETSLAQAVKLLLATETAVGGPYRTWLVSADSQPIWLDIDGAVNSNIAYFLSLVSNRLPALDALMEQAILHDTFASPYYPSPYAFIYYFARAYDGPQRDRLLIKTKQLHKMAKADLDRALSLSARLRLGDRDDLTVAVAELLRGQRADGSWPAAAFYADPVKNGKLYYNGAPALTTAFVIEALQLYIDHSTQPVAISPVHQDSDRETVQRRKILAAARRQCQPLAPELRRTTIQALESLAKSPNGTEIINLAARLNTSLAMPSAKQSGKLIGALSLANLYGWLAYTIYDDFLDDEGRPHLLPVANVTMRKSFDCFRDALQEQAPFRDLVGRTFDIIDSANAWELDHCRFTVHGGTIIIGALPDFADHSQLAERSLGHILAPLALLAARGMSTRDSTFRQATSALRHYLIVRQLNDDIHDWQDDLAKGHINYVVACVLADLDLGPGRRRLSDLLTKAQRQFWHHTLPIIVEEMQNHIDASRQALAASGLFKADNMISRLLDNFESSLAETAATQHQTIRFLEQYRRQVATS